MKELIDNQIEVVATELVHVGLLTKRVPAVTHGNNSASWMFPAGLIRDGRYLRCKL